MPNYLARDIHLRAEYQQPSRRPRLRVKLPPVGAHVRLNRLRGIYEKEASDTWTEEVFRVLRHKTSTPIPLIYVEDLMGDVVEGGLYPEEYQQVTWNGKRQVDKVIKERKRKGHAREYFVSYRGWPQKFNAWTKSL